MTKEHLFLAEHHHNGNDGMELSRVSLSLRLCKYSCFGCGFVRVFAFRC